MNKEALTSLWGLFYFELVPVRTALTIIQNRSGDDQATSLSCVL